MGDWRSFLEEALSSSSGPLLASLSAFWLRLSEKASSLGRRTHVNWECFAPENPGCVGHLSEGWIHTHTLRSTCAHPRDEPFPTVYLSITHTHQHTPSHLLGTEIPLCPRPTFPSPLLWVFLSQAAPGWDKLNAGGSAGLMGEEPTS